MHEAAITGTEAHETLGNKIKSGSLKLALSVIAGLLAGVIAFYIYEKKIRRTEAELNKERESENNILGKYKFTEEEMKNAKGIL